MERVMQVAKWGNSLAVRLPKSLVDKLKLSAGDSLSIVSATQDEIMVQVEDRRSVFREAMASFRWTAPQDYRFDRDEANAR
jgi:antitoxin MazE